MTPNADNVEQIVQLFQPIGIQEAENVAMLKRTDTKYLLSEHQLLALLKQWVEYYYILDINDQRILNYQTIYLDTPTFQLYKDHHNGKVNRYKVRFRDYVDSQLTYFEIKRKVNGDTIKKRLPSSFQQYEMNVSIQKMLQEDNILYHDLEIKVINRFKRISLISKQLSERITIDTDIIFSKDDKETSLSGIVVLEMKQEKADFSSMAMKSLKAAGIRPVNFSKYVTAVSLLDNDIKYNNAKPLHLKLQQLIKRHANI